MSGAPSQARARASSLRLRSSTASAAAAAAAAQVTNLNHNHNNQNLESVKEIENKGKRITNASEHEIRRTKSKSKSNSNLNQCRHHVLVSALTHEGVELMFSTTPQRDGVLVVACRTRSALQCLTVDREIDGKILALKVGLDGMIVTACQHGTVRSWFPIEADPRNIPFGKCRWIPGKKIQYSTATAITGTDPTSTASSTSIPTANTTSSTDSTAEADDDTDKGKVSISIGCAPYGKILIASGNTMSLHNASPSDTETSSDNDKNNNNNYYTSTHASLLWSTQMDDEATIIQADLAGDGKNIAYVLEDKGLSDHSKNTIHEKQTKSIHGVRTITLLHSKSTTNHEWDQNQNHDNNSDNITCNNISIKHKHGPFLTHSAPVTRLSFRGLGNRYPFVPRPSSAESTTTSNSHHTIEQHTQQSSLEHESHQDYNDLLLTQCATNGSTNIFSSATYNLLLSWNTPLGSRADWIKGHVGCNLGDLEPLPRPTNASSSSSSQNNTYPDSSITSPSTDPLNNTNHSAGINKHFHSITTPAQKMNVSYNQMKTLPTCDAGAWISELTFRGPFPALRLTRLSYLKSGSDGHSPAHLEGVAAILPPGTISPKSVLHKQDQYDLDIVTGINTEYKCQDSHDNIPTHDTDTIAVMGLWPAWDPWELHPASTHGLPSNDEKRAGSATALMGASPKQSRVTLAHDNVGAYGVGGDGLYRNGTIETEDTNLFGTHCPPSELRVISSHFREGAASILEFALLAERNKPADGGTVFELGSPLRYVLNFNEDVPTDVFNDTFKSNGNKTLPLNNSKYIGTKCEISGNSTSKLLHPFTTAPLPVTISTRVACLSFESGVLCATAHDDGKTVHLSWRRRGTANILRKSGDAELEEKLLEPILDDLSDDLSYSSNESFSPKSSYLGTNRGIPCFRDLSLLPLPLSLPSLILPPRLGRPSAIKWWPDENFGGPPRLLVLTSPGALVLYEMPPPWAALEPPMPHDDPLGGSVGSYSSHGEINVMDGNFSEQMSDTTDHQDDYELTIIPHADFGLGLRIEARGGKALAESFKRHPLNGGRLPAEKNGSISIGDELISVNDVQLEHLTFDDVINTIRVEGAKAKSEDPLRMKFRRGTIKSQASKIPINSLPPHNLANNITWKSTPSFGQDSIDSSNHSVSSTSNAATILVGADSESQQEFGRVVAIVRNALPPYTPNLDSNGSPRSLVLLPWHYGKGAPVPYEVRGATLVVYAVGRRVSASRLEVLNGDDPEHCSRYYPLGSTLIPHNNIGENHNKESMDITSLEVIKISSDGWCVAACDESGTVTLVYLNVEYNKDKNIQINSEKENLVATFRSHLIFRSSQNGKSGKQENKNNQIPRQNTIDQLRGGDFLLRAPSMELLGTMPSTTCYDGGNCDHVSVWSAKPCFYHHLQNDKAPNPLSTLDNYNEEKVYHTGIPDKECPILDFRWVPSGSLDAFPWLVTFSLTSAVVHRKQFDGDKLHKWKSIAEFTYPDDFRIHPIFPHDVKIDDSFRKIRYYGGCLSPADAFPHLIPTFRDIISVSDELHMKSDWSPECLLAEICTYRDGPHIALKKTVANIFNWLLGWMKEGAEQVRPQHAWDSGFRIACAPISREIYPENNALSSENDCTHESNSCGLNTTTEEFHFQELLDVLYPSSEMSRTNRTERIKQKKPSKEFLLAMAEGAGKNDHDDKNVSTLPDPLIGMTDDSLCLLWALGHILQNKLHKDRELLNKLDIASQLSNFSFMLTNSIQESGCKNMPPIKTDPSTHRRSSSMKAQSSIASGAVLSALISNTQSCLLETLRFTTPNKRINWSLARTVHMPFWLRSTSKLKEVSEEIGRDIFKGSRIVMECALFFIAGGNLKALKMMTATDISSSGRKFNTFLNTHNFSSARGRTAAEKNAFSLLRKKQYHAASAFFLLADPPMLKSALDVIVHKIEDIDLAFLVARLVEGRPKKAYQFDEDLTIGGMGTNISSLKGLNFGSGFASTRYKSEVSGGLEENDEYKTWTSDLSYIGRDLILDNDVQKKINYIGDACMAAVLLLWLKCPNDASLRLVGISKNESISCTTTIPPSFDGKMDDAVFSKSNFDTIDTKVKGFNLTQRALSRANAWIDYTCRPTVLAILDVPIKLQSASTLMLSQDLSRLGMEITSIQMLLSIPSLKCEVNGQSLVHLTNGKVMTESSSSLASHTKVTSHLELSDANEEDNVSSSMFDSYHAPISIQENKRVEKIVSTSSIFDSFDLPPVKAKTKVAADPMSTASSIFDSFDPPPVKAKTKVAADPMSSASSIFDSYEIPNQRNAGATSAKVSSKNAISTDDKYPNPKKCEAEDCTKIIDSIFPSQPTPLIWSEWTQNLLATTTARRLVRELARVLAPFRGDTPRSPIALFQRQEAPVVPHGAHAVLHDECNGEIILEEISSILQSLCELSGLEAAPIIECALLLLARPGLPQRIPFAVLLHCLTGRADLAEDVVRDAAHDLIRGCETFTVANSDLVLGRQTKHFASSHYARRRASTSSWQLELCLWLHRGGTFPMSSLALKETVIAVRTGSVIAGWGHCHELIENLLKCEPDFDMDHDLGRKLWASTKDLTDLNTEENVSGEDLETSGTTSGGWEFLVDCRRDEATTMLRDRKPGSFLLRPHAEDHGVFTLSFRTNLILTDHNPNPATEKKGSSKRDKEKKHKRHAKEDEVVQHAIVRLSDVGFRCGSFGPFSSLLKLLQAVSNSLPFNLLFSEPPIQGIIKDEGSQPSPNSVFIRKLSMLNFNCGWSSPKNIPSSASNDINKQSLNSDQDENKSLSNIHGTLDFQLGKCMGAFSQLLSLTEIRKHLATIAAAREKETIIDVPNYWDIPDLTSGNNELKQVDINLSLSKNTAEIKEDIMPESVASSIYDEFGEEHEIADASRIIRPILDWTRALEASVVNLVIPQLSALSQCPALSLPVALAASETAVEAAPHSIGSCIDGGDAIIRKMIQPISGVDFRTLRVGEGGRSAVVVLFGKNEAVNWIVKSGAEKDEAEACRRLEMMERRRVIERVDLGEIGGGKNIPISSLEVSNDKKAQLGIDVRYRFVDPWEVEALESKDGELRNASLGREHYVTFTIGAVVRACEKSQRLLGGSHLMALWGASRGGVSLTKALASVHPPWERDTGGDLHIKDGFIAQPTPYENCFRQHLYRNALFRRLNLPQRFITLVQIELLDLKNLTSPVGASNLTAYALLRLKRTASSAPLTHKARTLDSACTEPLKIGKSSGPNAPASWGSLVRFRFPLPEDVDCEGVSYDVDREALFKGPPSVLQVSVYEKKFMSDVPLGGADVPLDGLIGGGQIEEWVPLRSAKDGIVWFARIRLTLRFELMCLETENLDSEENLEDICPSVGLRKIRMLSQIGGAHEDDKRFKKSFSTPDFVSYLESMVLHGPD